MKKRLLSALLTLCMILALLPTMALAGDVSEYGVYVAGIPVTISNSTDVLNDGKVSYDPDTATLTLNGAEIVAPADDGDINSGICVEGGALTIHLIGKNTVEKTVGGSYRNAIRANGSSPLTITADSGASLSVTAEGGSGEISGNFGISANNGLTIKSGAISATGGEDSSQENYGIYVKGGNLAITGGSVTATALGTASAASYGIFCDEYNGGGNISISGNAIVNATGGAATGSSGGIRSKKDLTIENDATVTATGGAAATSTGLACAEGGALSR